MEPKICYFFSVQVALSGKFLTAGPCIDEMLAGTGSMKPLMRRKNDSRSKPLPPSKRLRLEAQRVLKERVQDIADKKGIKLRFCNLKECESHVHTLDSPCANIRMEIAWPPGVPFVHPHDLPNKAKIGFLEAYEPGWTATHNMELSLTEPGQASQRSANCNCNSPQVSYPHCNASYVSYVLEAVELFALHMQTQQTEKRSWLPLSIVNFVISLICSVVK